MQKQLYEKEIEREGYCILDEKCFPVEMFTLYNGRRIVNI